MIKKNHTAEDRADEGLPLPELVEAEGDVPAVARRERREAVDLRGLKSSGVLQRLRCVVRGEPFVQEDPPHSLLLERAAAPAVGVVHIPGDLAGDAVQLDQREPAVVEDHQNLNLPKTVPSGRWGGAPSTRKRRRRPRLGTQNRAKIGICPWSFFNQAQQVCIEMSVRIVFMPFQ